MQKKTTQVTITTLKIIHVFKVNTVPRTAICKYIFLLFFRAAILWIIRVQIHNRSNYLQKKNVSCTKEKHEFELNFDLRMFYTQLFIIFSMPYHCQQNRNLNGSFMRINMIKDHFVVRLSSHSFTETRGGIDKAEILRSATPSSSE